MRSDSTLYDWYTSLCPQGSRYETPFEEVLKEAREFFNGTQTPDYTLCIDHELRKQINRTNNERLKPPDAIFVEVPKLKCPNAPQPFWIYPGQILMAHIQVSKGSVKNGMFYTVSEIKHGNCLKPSQHQDDDQNDDQAANFVKVLNQENLFVSFECGLTFPLRVVAKSFRLSHCLTVSSSQGRTCDSGLRIISKHRRFGRKHMMPPH